MSSIEVAKEVIQVEIDGLGYMSSRLDESFNQAINQIIISKGRTIICGMGKSGLIGKKIVASFASTGTPSFFMHPGEAFHGDLGMARPEDIFIAISNSGETDEVLKLLPFLRDNGNFVIAVTGNCDSTLAVNSHCHLDISVPKEACPLQLAPTASTTATLVMGDALTVALMNARDFKPENFARFHPGGNLGKRLLSKVCDEMIAQNLPVVSPNDSFFDVVNSISSGKLGLALIICDDLIQAIITDGDLRRAIEKYGQKVFNLLAIDIGKSDPFSISPNTSVHHAYEIMETKGVSALVVQENSKLIGILKK